jgi:hypothetical protein
MSSGLAGRFMGEAAAEASMSTGELRSMGVSTTTRAMRGAADDPARVPHSRQNFARGGFSWSQGEPRIVTWAPCRGRCAPFSAAA